MVDVLGLDDGDSDILRLFDEMPSTRSLKFGWSEMVRMASSIMSSISSGSGLSTRTTRYTDSSHTCSSKTYFILSHLLLPLYLEMTQANIPATDPAVYASYQSKWATLPDTAEAWLTRAREVAQVLAQDAAQRDQQNKSPRAEVALLKHSGLLKLLGPKKYGGGEQPWNIGYKAVREVAKADGYDIQLPSCVLISRTDATIFNRSIGMLFGYHLLWSTTANVVGTAEQIERTQQLIISNNYFVGGAVNPRDNDLKITADGEHIVFNGAKHFNTGGVVSDLTVLEGVLEGTDGHIFALVPTQQPGIQFAHNWHNIGLRLTESGGVKIENVRVPWTDALGWDETTHQPREEVLTVPFATLLLPTYETPDDL